MDEQEISQPPINSSRCNRTCSVFPLGHEGKKCTVTIRLIRSLKFEKKFRLTVDSSENFSDDFKVIICLKLSPHQTGQKRVVLKKCLLVHLTIYIIFYYNIL